MPFRSRPKFDSYRPKIPGDGSVSGTKHNGPKQYSLGIEEMDAVSYAAPKP